MAFVKEYGRPQEAPGEWSELQDPETNEPVGFEIRLVPENEASKIEEKYGSLDKVTTDKGAVFKQRVLSYEDGVAIAIDKACYAWVRSRGLKVTPMDEEAVREWQRVLGEGARVVLGEPLDLGTDPLPTPVKRRILNRDHDLAFWITTRAEQQSKKAYDKEKVLRGN